MENNELNTSIDFYFKEEKYKEAIEYFKLNNDLTSDEAKEKWLKILQLFFYSDKIDLYPSLINKVISYIYTGKLETNLKIIKNKVVELNEEELLVGFSNQKPDIKKNFLNQLNNLFWLFAKRNVLLKLYKQYLAEVLNHLEEEGTISKIIVYEAPPYQIGNKVSHFFINRGIYYSQIAEKEINFKKNMPAIEEFKAKFSELEINLFKISKKHKNQENLIKKILDQIRSFINEDIVYTDLILMPIFIEPAIRKAWSSHESFNFGTKCIRRQLPEILFEWSIKHLEHSLKELHLIKHGAQKDRLFSKNCLIAIGTPLNTSVSIFEYFTSRNFLLETSNWTDITRLNSPTAHLKTKKRGVTFPLYKSNVIGGSNGPESVLIKNAFNLLD